MAFSGEKAVGLCFGWLIKEDDSVIDHQLNCTGFISDAFVSSDFRKQGIYKQLHTTIENHFIERGVDRLTYYTLNNNEPMKIFLGQAGFAPVNYQYQKWVK